MRNEKMKWGECPFEEWITLKECILCLVKHTVMRNRYMVDRVDPPCQKTKEAKRK